MNELTDLDTSLDHDDNEEFASESFLDSLEDRSEEEIPEIRYKKDEDRNEDNDMRWSIPLSEVPNALKISEFGHTYIYGRLKDPEGSITNKFHGFFKNSSCSKWKSLPGVLSDRYIVVSLEKFISNLKFKNLTENIVYNDESWKLAWIGTIDDPTYIIEYMDRSLLDFIFNSIYKENISSHPIISKLGVAITNTYNGTNKLKLSPIVKTTLINKENNFDFIDYFTFSNFTQVISHSSNQSSINDDLTVIKENIGEHISMLINFTDTNSIIRSICNCFRKPNRSIFEDIINKNISNNLFNVLIMSSIVLYKKYSVVEHLAIRSKIESFLEREIF